MRFYLDNAKDMAHAYHYLSQGFFQGFAKLARTSESSRTLFCVSRRSIGVAAGVAGFTDGLSHPIAGVAGVAGMAPFVRFRREIIPV